MVIRLYRKIYDLDSLELVQREFGSEPTFELIDAGPLEFQVQFRSAVEPLFLKRFLNRLLERSFEKRDLAK